MRTMAPPPAVSLVPPRDPRCQPHRGSFLRARNTTTPDPDGDARCGWFVI